VQAWVKRYQAAYGAKPDLLEALAYDATNMVITAAASSGSNDPTTIRDSLQLLSDFSGVTGRIGFDAHGDPIKSAAIQQVMDGRQRFFGLVEP
jgi:branched-chain amino acid transport system substrate-binding protein